MTDRCLEVEELGALARAPQDDPRRAHVESCPRCAARLADYLDFMRAPQPVEGGDVVAAEHALAEAVRKEWDARHGDAVAPAPPDGARSWRFRALGAIRETLRQPAWAAAAALLVVTSAAWLWLSPGRSGLSGDSLRGAAPGAASSVAAIAGASVRVAGDSLEFRWSPVEGAEHYAVVFYSADLVEIARRTALSGPSLRVLRADLVTVGGETARLWQVVALRAGEEIARSEPGTIR